jgi:hypothetical protein
MKFQTQSALGHRAWTEAHQLKELAPLLGDQNDKEIDKAKCGHCPSSGILRQKAA